MGAGERGQAAGWPDLLVNMLVVLLVIQPLMSTVSGSRSYWDWHYGDQLVQSPGAVGQRVTQHVGGHWCLTRWLADTAGSTACLSEADCGLRMAQVANGLSDAVLKLAGSGSIVEPCTGHGTTTFIPHAWCGWQQVDRQLQLLHQQIVGRCCCGLDFMHPP